MKKAERNELAYLFGDICDSADYPPMYCAECGEEMTGGYAYKVDGEWICDQCFDEYIQELTHTQLAEALGITQKWRG